LPERAIAGWLQIIIIHRHSQWQRSNELVSS